MVVRGSSSKPRTPNALERFDDDVSAREGADAVAVSERGHDGLDSELAYASSPSALDVSASDPSASLDSDGRDVSASYTHGSDGRSTSIGAGVSTGAGWAGVTIAADGKSTSIGGSLAKGWLGADGGVSWAALDGSASRVSGGAGWYPGGIALDAGVAHTTADGRTVKLGAIGFFDADREVKDLGPAENDAKRRRIEVRRSTGSAGTLTPGAATALLGVGGRLGAGKERAVVYRTTLDDEQARALLFEKKGAVGWLRDKARALKLADDPVVIPDARDPSTLALGDELVTTVSGSFSAGLFIGGLPLRLGAQGLMRGDFTLGVKRLDEHRMEVVVTPENVKAIQGRLGAPWLLEGDLSRSTSKALTQGFVFDLREPESRAAYDRVFLGELPGGLPNKVKGRRRESSELLSALESEDLPAGVKRSFVDQVELKREQAGLSVSFALWFKGGSFAGLGAQGVKLDERRVRLDASGVRETDLRGTERRRQVLLSGDESRGVYASLQRTTRYDDDGKGESQLEHLALTLKLSDSKVWGKELDDEIISALNERFALKLTPMKRDGRKQSREVSVSRRLDAADLARLAALSSSSAGEGRGELRELSRHLSGTKSDLERAEAVQTFVAEGGLDAMAVLVRALGDTERTLVVQTSSAAYSGPVEEARELLLRYPVPIAADDDNKLLSQRFKAGERARREAKLGLEDLAHDPLVTDEQRKQLAAELEDAQAIAARALATAHLDDESRRRLITRLESGWTTGDEQRVLDHLRR